jgi:predicted component of type VI protein secretion system
MVELEILSGKTAGARWTARRFPVRVGRSAHSDLQLEEHGVWDEHFLVTLDPGAGFVLQTQPNALVVANGQPTESAVLRNGDTIEIGAVKLRFWLSEARQRGLAIRETLFWILVGAVCLAQIALIYWLSAKTNG